ncbi:MAG: hypothetical protein V4563_06500 [Pseudomonadota bacterium]
MSDATDLEKKLEEKSTNELQNSIMNNHLTEEASAIAHAILAKRGASIPEAISEDVLEERYKKLRGNSNRSFVLTIVALCVWVGYGYITGEFDSGQEKRLNSSMLITFLSIASIWGWDVLKRKK